MFPRWYTLIYRLIYLLRLRIWERRKPPVELVAVVEGAAALPAGRALDLGCGSGTDSIYLARHGWTVTGVDIVPEAVVLARRNAAAAGVSVRFLEGDATRLQDLGLGAPFDLLVDFGCFHTLPADQRPAYVRGVSALAASGATFLLYGFARPPRLAPMKAGLTEAEVRERFSGAGWDVLKAEHVGDDPIVVARARVDQSFQLWRYLLRRRASVTAPSTA
jgi:SAM-dependent methyltransferase